MIALTHSIPEPNSLVIRTAGRHGAPYRRLEIRSAIRWSAPADVAALRRLGEEGVLAP